MMVEWPKTTQKTATAQKCGQTKNNNSNNYTIALNAFLAMDDLQK